MKTNQKARNLVKRAQPSTARKSKSCMSNIPTTLAKVECFRCTALGVSSMASWHHRDGLTATSDLTLIIGSDYRRRNGSASHGHPNWFGMTQLWRNGVSNSTLREYEIMTSKRRRRDVYRRYLIDNERKCGMSGMRDRQYER